ncbi:MAG: Crp/Fnr family transcriptional regulator [Vulcanimicrobiota bacterium]
MEKLRKETILGDKAWFKEIEPDEVLFWQNDTPTALYQVVDGFVKLVWNSSCGRETISEFLFPGDILDFPSFLDGSAYPFTCKASASGGARVAVLTRAAYLDSPDIAARCHHRLLSQLQSRRGQHVACPADRVEVRLSRALMCLGQRLGKPLGQSLRFSLYLTRQEVAEWIGTTTETVIRLCSEWKRRALIDWGRRSLTLVNPRLVAQMGQPA